MPFNGSGTFNRVMNWVNDAAANIKIRADRHDQEDDNLAAGLSNCITKDGQTIITNDIPLNGHKLTNVGNPVDAQDAVTRGFLDSFGGWSTSKFISGADANGRLNFTSLTGVNGITWSSIGAAWVAKIGVNDREQNRVVLNNNVDVSGTDVVAIDERNGGMMWQSYTDFSQNLIYDQLGSWRTPVAGTGGLLRKTATALQMMANSVATTLAYGVASLETFWQVYRSGGGVVEVLNKKASGDLAAIVGQMDGTSRWMLQLGTGHAEDSSSDGSYAYLSSYTNAGVNNFHIWWASRKDGKLRIPQGIAGDLLFDGKAYNSVGNGMFAGKALGILAGETGCRIWPRGFADSVNQTTWDTAGLMTVGGFLKMEGLYERSGSGGSYGSQVFNFLYVDSANIWAYVGGSHVANMTPACDYRLKKDDQPLPSTWEAVKALRPIRYTDRAYGELFKDGDVERWGFLAHELQETLTPSAANGEKDGPDLQVPNLITIIAALTAALQEAEVRIEALEAKAA